MFGWLLVLGTFALGCVAKALTAYAEARASAWTGLPPTTALAGTNTALFFLFGFAAPLREASKVAAVWPVFRSKYFDGPERGLTYATAAALGFATVESALTLRAHPAGWIWVVRVAAALPAHVFFACAWGYALGRAKRKRRPGPIFPATWIGATAVHGLYAYLVFGRGPGALLGTIPLLLAMATTAFFVLRDLRSEEGEVVPSSRSSSFLGRVSSFYVSGPPSLRTVREAMRREGQPIAVRWILFGVLVTIGAMTVGLAAAVGFGHWAHVDFSAVDEHDVATTAPVALLGTGLLLAFPVSGYLLARASSLPTLLEPAAAAGLAIAVTLVLLGLAAPVALVFALAFSPFAWGLACAGAWIGRPPGRASA